MAWGVAWRRMYDYRQKPREKRKHDEVGAYCTGEEQLTAGSGGRTCWISQVWGMMGTGILLQHTVTTSSTGEWKYTRLNV